MLVGIGKRTAQEIIAANVVGAALAAGAGALTGANIKGQRGFGLVDTVTLCVYLLITLSAGSLWGTKAFLKATAWIDEGRDPTPVEQKAALRLPFKYAVASLVGWVGAACVWSILTSVSHSWEYVVRVAASILLGGLTTAAVTYLLTEWSHRPLARLALAARVPDRPLVPGVRTRLIASWAVGADVFLLLIGLTFVGRPSGQPPSAAAVWFIVVAG